jgi:plastocyanin
VVQSNWNKVIELDPTSALAQNVQQHLTALADASMLPGSSGAPASSAAPAASPAGAVPSVAPGSTVLQQTAQNVQFGVGTLSAPANTPFTIHFANNDNDVQHDIVITDPAGTPVFTGALIDGGTATDYQVGALPAGTYTFKCSLHPVMTGTLTVGP